ncbi:hypothetical protein, conserved [Babesia ovata]|uniref:6-Cys domain-containing protein n=1 Tax=Babesia ovata TaxID=189622 RepID=A0A2H6KH78_9APIC|nr:uncharacterized protein BOVATA_038390 [Babesia ovata]GBE62346.1 hypothetical protein, conserved [Babesia ovata]
MGVGGGPPIFKKRIILDFDKCEVSTKSTVSIHQAMLLNLNTIEVICPRRKTGMFYDMLPNRRESIGSGGIHVYATVNGVYKKVHIDDVVRFRSAENQPKLEQRFGMTRLLLNQGRSTDVVRYAFESFDVHCAPAGNEEGVSEALRSCLTSMSMSEQEGERTSCPSGESGERSAPLLGIVRVTLSSVRRAYTGCGSSSVPFIMDASGGVSSERSCIVDVMETPDVGFYCKGRIEPANCPLSLYYGYTDRIATLPFKVEVSSEEREGGTVLIMRYDRLSISSTFSGYCRCVDVSTKQATAKIEIRSRKNYVCDLGQKLAQHVSRPIVGDWCDVMLYPGSSLEILFPVYPVELLRPVSVALLGGWDISGRISTFIPERPDAEALTRTVEDNRLVYSTVRLGSVVDTELVKVDSVLQSDGVVSIQHKVSQSEAGAAGRDPVSLYFRCLHRGARPERNVISTIKVTLSYGPRHEIVPVYAQPDASQRPVRVSQYFADVSDIARIHCEAGEQLVPQDCNKLAFNANRTAVVPFPTGLKAYWHHDDGGIRDLKAEDSLTAPFSLHCSCVNAAGLEISRLSFNQMPQNYTMRGRSPHINSLVMVPRIQLLDVAGVLRHEKIVIPVADVYREEHVLRVSPGTLNGLLCTPPRGVANVSRVPLPDDMRPFVSPVDASLQGVRLNTDTVMLRQDEDVSKSYATWIPYNDGTEFVNLVKTGDQYQLTSAHLSEVMVAKGGFSIGHKGDHDSDLIDRSDLAIRYPLGSIVLSKHGHSEITLHYICGSVSVPRTVAEENQSGLENQATKNPL